MEKFSWFNSKEQAKKDIKNVAVGVMATVGSLAMHEGVSAQTHQDTHEQKTEQVSGQKENSNQSTDQKTKLFSLKELKDLKEKIKKVVQKNETIESVDKNSQSEKHATANENKINNEHKRPFSVEYKTDSVAYRAIDSAKGRELDFLMMEAKSNAKAKIAEQYAKDKHAIKTNAQGGESFKVTLKGMQVIDEKAFEDEKGVITYYVAMEMPK